MSAFIQCLSCGRRTRVAEESSMLTFVCGCGRSVDRAANAGLPCPFEVISGTPLPVTAEGGGTRKYGASVALKASEIALSTAYCKDCGNPSRGGQCDACAWRSQQASGTGAAAGPVGPTPRTSGPLGLGPRRPGTCVVCSRAAWAHTESADHLFCPEPDPVGPFIPRAAVDAVQRTAPKADELDWRKFAEEAARGFERAAGIGQRVSLDGILPSDRHPSEEDVGRSIQRTLVEKLAAQLQRANLLADRCQTLEDEKREILVENAELRRKVDRLERKR